MLPKDQRIVLIVFVLVAILSVWMIGCLFDSYPESNTRPIVASNNLGLVCAFSIPEGIDIRPCNNYISVPANPDPQITIQDSSINLANLGPDEKYGIRIENSNHNIYLSHAICNGSIKIHTGEGDINVYLPSCTQNLVDNGNITITYPDHITNNATGPVVNTIGPDLLINTIPIQENK